MQRKRDLYFKKAFIILPLVLMMSGIAACGHASSNAENKSPAIAADQRTETIINNCSSIFETATEEKKTEDSDLIRNLVDYFGENGYPAVDSNNLVNMTEAAKVLDFCKKVDLREEGDLTIFVVDSPDGIAQNNLRTEDGTVTVDVSYYEYADGRMKRTAEGSYQAASWKYTEEGYLMYSGVWYSEDMYVLSMSGIEEYTALRVQPLDEACRELSLKYLRPIGFERNNLFTTDWNEGDFGSLDFYDLFDRLYPEVYGQQNPYRVDDNLSVGAVYQIPKEEFETVIMQYFSIESTTLQSKTIYHPESATYEYRPRGFREIEYPEYPYSEVTGYTENSDGTITLLANVVFPRIGDSKVYTHEVVVRPQEDGGVQYVSNRIVPAEDNAEVTWYTPRLTPEEWENYYENNRINRKHNNL